MSTEHSDERSFAKPMPGDVLAGKYQIENVLGRGGMGIVVAATHLQLGQRVAIKYLLRPDNEETVARFLREARAVARLRSEHIARVLDVGTFDNDVPYMVMEHLDGIDLLKYLIRNGPLPIDEAVDYLLQTCEAIAEAHALGIIHRDLKPANLFLTTAPDESSSIKVLDFGISKMSDDQAKLPDGMQLTNTEAVLGSPYYMSPEQLKSTRNVDTRGDIWSLGVILYQLLVGKVPFTGKSSFEVGLKATYEQPPSLTKMRNDVSPDLEAVILKCLEKKPDDRFNDVAELAFGLAPFGLPSARASAEKTKRVLDAGNAAPGSRRGDALAAPGSRRGDALAGPTSTRGVTAVPAPEVKRPEPIDVQTPALDTTPNAATVPMPTLATRPKVRTGMVVGAAFAVLLVVGGGVTVLLSMSSEPDEQRTGAESAPALGDKPVRNVEPVTVNTESPSASASSVGKPLTRTAKSASSTKVEATKVDSTPTKTNKNKNPLKEVGIE